MELTPIKVKGRGRQKKAWRPPDPRRVMEKRKRTQDDGPVEGADGWCPKRFKSKKPPAPIENLPVEILERIILMSRNLNVLFSSVRIGKRFSHPHFLTEVVEEAFGPTWDKLFAHPRTRKMMLRHADQRVFDLPGDPVFQSAVLACRWVNVRLVLAAQQKWARRTGGPEWFDKLPEHHPRRHRALRRMKNVKRRYEKDWVGFKVGCMDFLDPPEFADPPEVWLGMLLHIDKRIDVHPQTRIPPRLLTGPFDWDSIRLLFWLVRGGARLQPEHAWDWELTLKGFDNVMALGDQDIAVVYLKLLSSLGAFKRWPRDLLKDKLQTAQDLEQTEAGGDDELLWGAVRYILESEAELAQQGIDPSALLLFNEGSQ
ncbi:hypothetical protein C8A03DRAFT_45685 [Achaetomium macrosporum]|uniref:Uncharacterized protein n=1 Tax=Achaetomium macrosporum TaxID=79813 RepID=A0AAN7C789_9PEZI|nr:hypothetical protein C8A03DRAFT_45685 [Achaetomium macrosporum]